MSESLTRRKNAANCRKAAGFIAESRPASRLSAVVVVAVSMWATPLRCPARPQRCRGSSPPAPASAVSATTPLPQSSSSKFAAPLTDVAITAAASSACCGKSTASPRFESSPVKRRRQMQKKHPPSAASTHRYLTCIWDEIVRAGDAPVGPCALRMDCVAQLLGGFVGADYCVAKCGRVGQKRTKSADYLRSVTTAVNGSNRLAAFRRTKPAVIECDSTAKACTLLGV
jgi:hypothetical protein